MGFFGEEEEGRGLKPIHRKRFWLGVILVCIGILVPPFCAVGVLFILDSFGCFD